MLLYTFLICFHCKCKLFSAIIDSMPQIYLSLKYSCLCLWKNAHCLSLQSCASCSQLCPWCLLMVSSISYLARCWEDSTGRISLKAVPSSYPSDFNVKPNLLSLSQWHLSMRSSEAALDCKGQLHIIAHWLWDRNKQLWEQNTATELRRYEIDIRESSGSHLEKDTIFSYWPKEEL